MNGWADRHPEWWLNLRAQPEASVDMPDGSSRLVRARAASGDERTSLWTELGTYGDDDLDGLAARRSRETPVVVLEPRASSD